MPSSVTTSPAMAGLFLRSLAFWIGWVLSLSIVSTMVVLCFWRPFPQRYRICQKWTRFSIWWLRITCRIDYCVRGAEHIPNDPVVVIAKHQSTWETLFLQYYLPPLSWVIKRELLWLPFFGWAMALLRPIAINRQSPGLAVRQVIRKGTAYLQRGQWVLVFPEGTRVAPGEKGRYNTGGAALAVHSQCAVLPVALNAGAFWPRTGFIKYPGTVQVVFGPVISSAGASPQALNRRIEAWIEEEMARITGQKNNDSNK